MVARGRASSLVSWLWRLEGFPGNLGAWFPPWSYECGFSTSLLHMAAFAHLSSSKGFIPASLEALALHSSISIFLTQVCLWCTQAMSTASHGFAYPEVGASPLRPYELWVGDVETNQAASDKLQCCKLGLLCSVWLTEQNWNEATAFPKPASAVLGRGRGLVGKNATQCPTMLNVAFSCFGIHLVRALSLSGYWSSYKVILAHL